MECVLRRTCQSHVASYQKIDTCERGSREREQIPCIFALNSTDFEWRERILRTLTLSQYK
ncbi:MAG: hypothetical protein KatS3mg058_1672 [Roseiflexus sp.]|nr:MAG: hypothetical protein KatS3mg058_1672 [Roseiflexus sp.]